MIFANFIRGLVKRNPNLKYKLRRAGSKQTPYQYVFQSIFMAGLTVIALMVVVFMVFKSKLLMLIGLEIGLIVFSPVIYSFWLSYVDVQIRKYARELDSDLLFVSEYFLVSLESGLPIGNSIQRISRLDRPGGRFFRKVYTDFKTGKDFEKALDEGADYSASELLKILLKRLKDSLRIGVDLRMILINFIADSSEKKFSEIRAFSKKLNPIVMMYLLLGIVLPSLGVTFFILAAAIMDIEPEMLKYILIFIFLIMFAFQYISYSSFKFGKASI